MKPSGLLFFSFIKKIIPLIMLPIYSWGQITQIVDSLVPNDSGWIKVFRGNNDEDFLTLNKNTKGTFPNTTFTKQGDTLKASGASPHHVLFKQIFSHYTVRYQQHFPNDRFGNAGMLIHTSPDDPYLVDLFPRSVESQGDPRQGLGQLWCISDVFVDVKARIVDNRPQYDPTASMITYGGEADNKRLVTGIDGYGQPSLSIEQNQNWIQFEAHVYGSDSITHTVNGQVIIKYGNVRVAEPGNPNNIVKMLDQGLIAWQSEGVPVWYRNMYVKLHNGDDLYDLIYGGCMDSSFAEYKSYYEVSQPTKCITSNTDVIWITQSSLPIKLIQLNSFLKEIVLEIDYPKYFELKVHSISGRELHVGKKLIGKKTISLSIPEAGIYFFRLILDNKIIAIKKIIVP